LSNCFLNNHFYQSHFFTLTEVHSVFFLLGRLTAETDKLTELPTRQRDLGSG